MSFRKAFLFLIVTFLIVTAMVYAYLYLTDGVPVNPLIFMALFGVIGLFVIGILSPGKDAVDFVQSFFSKGKRAEKDTKPYDISSSQNELNRKNVIANVRSGYIEGVLNQALHKKVRIELKLEHDPTALMREMELWEGQQVHRSIPQKDDITDVFDDAGRALLILGAAGSGKTIALLELCKDLLKRAEKKQEPVPVVLNLSTWAEKKGALDQWIVTELHRLYTLNKKVGQAWLDGSQMYLLLDGLDEVAVDVREECVEAINQFREAYIAPMVVCSRFEDYKNLSNKLHLQTAVFIKPLEDEQIKKYLTDSEMNLQAVYDVIQEDAALKELCEAPLNLNLMALAFENYDLARIRPLLMDVDGWREHLYNAYVVRMFQRRPLGDVKYDESKALRWLQYLAKQLTKREETQFFVGELRSNWLSEKGQRHQKWLDTLFFGLIFGLGFSLFSDLACGLVLGIGLALVFGFGPNGEFLEDEKWIWTGVNRDDMFFGLAFGIGVCLIVSLFSGLEIGLAFGLFAGLVIALGKTLRLKQRESYLQITLGYERPKKSFGLVLVFGIGIGLIFSLVFSLGLNLVRLGGLLAFVSIGWAIGLSMGIVVVFAFVMQHYLLRLTLHLQNLLPLRLVPFLDDMSDHLILQNAGAYFRFFHRSMQEHFAALSKEDIDRLVAEIKDATPRL